MRQLTIFLLILAQNLAAGQLILPENDTALINHFIKTGVKQVTAYDYICTAKNCPEEPSIRKRILFDKNGNISQITTYEYSKVLMDIKRTYENNLLQSESVYKNDSVLITSLFKYDLSGNMIEHIDTGRSGQRRYFEVNKYDDHNNITLQKIINKVGDTLISQYRYRYDSNGNKVQETSLYPDQKMKFARYYEYDSLGRLHVLFNLDPKKGKVPLNKYHYKDDLLIKKVLFNEGDTTTTHIYTYDGENLIHELVYDHVHETEYVVTRKYGKHGIKEEVGKYKLDTELNYKYTVRYDCKGNDKKTTYYNRDGSVSKIIRKKHDKKGNLTEFSFSGTEYVYQIIEYRIEYF